MRRRAATVLTTSLGLVLGLTLTSAAAQTMEQRPRAGAAGVGDPYFPKDGNGGYDARHYRLAVTYRPGSDRLTGKAVMRARATMHLSRFNLDLDGLRVHSVRVNGRSAQWSRRGGELRITPVRTLKAGRAFTSVVRYGGVPRTLADGSGFIHTDDGALVIGEPHVAASWYPVNDHPIDKASYSFRVTVPAGRQAVANGELVRKRTRDGWTTWHWEAEEPMASYLTTASIGKWRINAYQRKGIRFWDALDPDLFDPVVPRTGSRFALSQRADSSYKRLTRIIAVPAEGAELSF
jgi:aminopeptidase N